QNTPIAFSAAGSTMSVVSRMEACKGMMSSSWATIASVVVFGGLSAPKARTTKKTVKNPFRNKLVLLRLRSCRQSLFAAKLFFWVAIGIVRIRQAILVVINPQCDGLEVLRSRNSHILSGPLAHNALGLFLVEPEQLLVGRSLNLRVRQENVHRAGFVEECAITGALGIQAALRHENVAEIG